MEQTAGFEAERRRLLRLAGRMLSDPSEAEDIVQQAWLRLRGSEQDIANLPAWLTTVTTRLCLDRLRARIPVPVADEADLTSPADDPAEQSALADTVGVALQVVLDRLSPAERVAFVLHDTFGFDFATIAAMLDVSPQAARKLASRARAKVAQPAPEDALADWEVVDAFLTAARPDAVELAYAVGAQHRGASIGARAVAAALDLARLAGVSRAVLTIARDNAASQATGAAAGFARTPAAPQRRERKGFVLQMETWERSL